MTRAPFIFADHSGGVPALRYRAHVVPLVNAHISGGWAWHPDRKQAYANDLANPEHLLAVKAQLNRQKGDKSPDQWKPPRQEYWCDYATAWLAIKQR